MGGVNQRDDFYYQDAYILSLPGFVWTRLPDPPGDPRKGAACVPVGNRQVLNYGGYNGNWSYPDPNPRGLLLFDMTTLEWKHSYDANAAAYESPNVVREWYRNGYED